MLIEDDLIYIYLIFYKIVSEEQLNEERMKIQKQIDELNKQLLLLNSNLKQNSNDNTSNEKVCYYIECLLTLIY